MNFHRVNKARDLVATLRRSVNTLWDTPEDDPDYEAKVQTVLRLSQRLHSVRMALSNPQSARGERIQQRGLVGILQEFRAPATCVAAAASLLDQSAQEDQRA
jgi:hypothetical protein